MKKIFKQSFLLLAILGVMFTSCKKDYLEPPIQVLPIGTVYTIDQILAMESGTVFNEDASVYGIVTADEQSGNLYKAAFMQDRATGKAIELYMNATSGVRIGDSIRVYLKDVTYTQYNGLPQLSNFEADGHIVILANNKPIQPAEATIADVVAGNYLAGLVKLSNVMFTEKNTFAEPTTYGNRTLVDPSDFSKSVIVRTSNYANFANDSLPQGTGNLVCIASVYGSTWQLLIRSATELEFDGYTPSGGGSTLPYYQDFASSFGTYSTYDVSGAQSWMIDYSTAKMTGYENSVNNANEDWLISAPVSLEGVTEASLTMKYIARYFSNLNQDVTIQVSSDYTTGDPNNASWTEISANLSEGSNWNDFFTAEVDLSQFAGQKVVVAVKYLSNETKAGTIEIQSMLIQEGFGGVTPPEPPAPGGELQSMPYTQSFATEFGSYMIYDVEGPQGWVIDYSTAKMTGYESGTNYVNQDWLISSPVAVTGVQNAKASVTYVAQYQNSNPNDVTMQVSTDYVWGNDPSTANWTQMSTTYPNTGGWSDFQTVETSLNDFIGQNVTVAIKFTSTDSQSRTLEVQSITVQEGEAGGVTPPGPGTVTGDGSRENPYTANDIILLGIESSDGNKYWVKDYIVGVIDGSYVYQFTSNTDVMTNIILSSNANTSSDAECIPIQLPTGAVREGLNLVDNPGNLGQEVLLYGTLEKYFRVPGVKTVTYAEINGNGIGTDPGVEPPTPQGIFTETFANGQGDFVIENTYLPDGLTYVWSHAANYSCMKASAYVGHAYETESWLVSPYIDLSNCTSATLTFEQAVNYASPQGALYMMITTEYEGTVSGIEWDELELSTWPSGSDWTFVTSTADLTPYVGQRVTIAFMYTSTNSASATWEVKNFVVAE